MDSLKEKKAKGFKSLIPVRSVKVPNKEILTNASLKAKETTKAQKNIKPNITNQNISKERKVLTVSRQAKVLCPSKPVRTTNDKSLNKKTPSINSNRRLKNAAVENENKQSTESSSTTRQCSSLSKKTVKKNLTTQPNLENKGFIPKQNENKKSILIESSSLNQRKTNVNNANFKASKLQNIVDRRLTNAGKRQVGIDTKNKCQIISAQPQITNDKKPSTEIEQDRLVSKTKQDELKLCASMSVNQGINSSNMQDKEKAVVQKIEEKTNLKKITQPDFEFVADERYREQILSCRELTPNLKTLNKPKCSSVYERPSIFKSSVNFNKAIERLTEEGHRLSMLKLQNRLNLASASSPQIERLSLFKSSTKEPFSIRCQKAIVKLEEEGRRISLMKIKPASSVSQFAMNNQQASILKAIENVDLASENRKASALKKHPLHVLSPRMDKGPFQGRSSASAYEIVQKRLDAMQLKQKIKSSKKVTFNLEVSDSPKLPKPAKKKLEKDFETWPTDEDNEEKDEKLHPTPELTQKTPSPKALSPTQPTFKMERNVTESHFNAMMLRICGYNCASTVNTTPTKSRDPKSPTSKVSPDKAINKPFSPVGKVTLGPHCAISQSVGPVFKSYNRLQSSIQPSSELRNSLYSFRNSLYLSRPELRNSLYSSRPELRNSLTGSHIKNSMFSSQTVGDSGLRRNTLSRLCTPKPVSFYPRANLAIDTSPEFMGRRTSCIVAQAPISTPMVMRNLAESFEETLSPVAQDAISPLCQRLDFDEIENENSDNVTKESENSQELQKRVQEILTGKNIDQFVDEECSTIYESATFSVVFEKRLINPIAHILSQGDDMHFVPLKIS